MYTVNPLRLLTDNLFGYAESLHAERVKLWLRNKEIDDEMILLGQLGKIMGIDIGTTVQYAHDKKIVAYAPYP
jgi:hypothetical protein